MRGFSDEKVSCHGAVVTCIYVKKRLVSKLKKKPYGSSI